MYCISFTIGRRHVIVSVLDWSPTCSSPMSLAVDRPRSDLSPLGTTWKIALSSDLHPGTITSASTRHSTIMGDGEPYACKPFKRIQSSPPMTLTSAPESTRNWIGLDDPNWQLTSTSARESVHTVYNRRDGNFCVKCKIKICLRDVFRTKILQQTK
ncbi:uncharacterized protein LOC131691404 isoform X1 [Topomyia yanbarensis]|uniref:uncharacterized protein LOC131691404 isoform X1 n=1 Tax=Topomyia yanbarensis TaxID=2498891 RepID=UPI00273B4D6C|nr:uncharacterized protein LOC131691404 isoform X1 [Topomyia yanbarensis]